MTMEEDKGKRLLGYAVNYIADVGNGQQFQVTGSLPLDATLDQFKTEFNKMRDAGEQQRTRSVIPNLKEGIKKMELGIARLLDTIDTFDKGAKNRALASNEKNQREQLLTNLKHDREELAYKKEVLATAEKELQT